MEICEFLHHRRIKIYKNDFETSPLLKDFALLKSNWFYCYQLHVICSINGFLNSLDITKSEISDIKFPKNTNYTTMYQSHTKTTCFKHRIAN